MSWFPRPRTLEDIDTAESTAYDAPALWALLHRPSAEEWRDRVGVAGARDGSAKPTVRLLCSDGMVLKTNLATRFSERAAATAEVQRMRDFARRHALWHPDKEWFVTRHRDGFLVMSVCPRLTTLREKAGGRARLDAWVEVVRFAAERASRDGLGLDLNPANFGHDTTGTLRYIDDEWYATKTSFHDLGDFVAARLLEDAELQPLASRWGAQLARALRAVGARRTELSLFAEAVASYPLPSGRAGARRALLEGLMADRGVPMGARPRPHRTCVLADVHGNLAALQAVLQAVEDIGVDEFIVLGDLVGYGPQPKQCLERVAALPALRIVRGNHDDAVARGSFEGHPNRHARWALEWTLTELSSADRSWLGSLPLEIRTDTFLAVHGAPRDPERVRAYVYQLTYRENLAWLREHEVAVCFHGHTHVPFVYEGDADGDRALGTKPVQLSREAFTHHLINPGSVGQPRDGDARAAFALWDRGESKLRFHRVPYPVEDTAAVMANKGFPADLIHRLSLGR